MIWIIPCNNSMYDLVSAIKDLNEIEWKQSTNVNVGDTVYIYLCAPYKLLYAKFFVEKNNLSKNTIDDSKYVLDGSNFSNYGRYMRLILVEKLDRVITLDDLKKNGLKGNIQGPVKASDELCEYLEGHLSNNLEVSNSEYLILQKMVDKSVLTEGMSIPSTFQKLFYDKIGFELSHGSSAPIKIVIGDELFDATLKNQAFDKQKYAGHTDVLQIRYSKNSILSAKFRSIFSVTNDFLNETIALGVKRIIPEEKREYIAIYSTPIKGTLLVECITCNDYQEESNTIKQLEEKNFELLIDSDSAILEKYGIKKVRKLSKGIGNSLKMLYGYRCQICGEYIGEKYGSNIIHAHHIDYFTKSMNNNADNIMIVCPNHHGIIHDKNPDFNKENKTYKYPNGYIEGLKLNQHL